MRRLVRSILGRHAQPEHVLVLLVTRVEPGILQDSAFVADMQQIAVHRIGFLRRDRHRDPVRFGVGDHLGPSGKFLAEPLLPPWRDDFQFRRQGRRGQLEAHLVIALARGSVRHCCGALGPRDFDHTLGNERTCDARAEKILPLIESPRPEHGEDEVAREFLLQVVDEALRRPRAERLLLQAVELLLLPDVGAEGDDLRVVCFFQPLQQDRRVQATRVSAYDLHQPAFLHRSHGAGNAGADLPKRPRRGRKRDGACARNAAQLPVSHSQR